ncbi:L-rhamnose mutarotase [Amphibacillus marinus]|uniref:L-rhamnose mutarotase n=1 Tax=Amphibacillus marinus TaxID=872970 RepID=A0A1H8H5S4_9BACI|nr:L-rhamnose mutarotase [Amphibacillus marinus]SEN51702.1 L-rhamnose mutarotase [Amphibacillus marinus]
MRKAFKMRVHPDQHDEYYKRHQELWPELLAVLNAHGVVTYGIYLDKQSSELFAFLEASDEEQWERVAATAINQKWWTYMAPIMDTNSDQSPVTIALDEMFFIKGGE